MNKSPSATRRTLSVQIACALSAGLVAILLASPAPGITIDLSYDEDDSPSFDPNGTRLMTIARAAADYWEWHILDDEEIQLDISWDNLDGEHRYAKYVPSYVPLDSIDIVLSTHADGAAIPWFFDDTPHASEEFQPFIYRLHRDLIPTHADEAFAGPNVPLLEVGVEAFALPDSPARGSYDLLSFLMHEFGHALGMNFSATDDDYDFDSADIGGLDVGAFESDGYELVLNTALMNDSIKYPGQRRFPSATDILATHDQGDFTNFNLRRIDLFGGHSEDWQDTLNWIGGKAPEWYNDAFARNGESVRIETGLVEVRSLLVDESSAVYTAGNSHLKVIHELRIGNASNGTSGEVHVGNYSGTPWLEAESLKLDKGLVHLTSQGSTLLVHGAARIAAGGTLMGAGTVEVQGELNNDGEISAGTFFLFGSGGDLLLRAIDNGKLDLDGGQEPILDPGVIAFVLPGQFNDEFGRLSAVSGNLRVLSPLADAFNGTATIGPGRMMNFYQPWSFGGAISMRGGTTAADAARLTGAEILFGGTTTVRGIATIDAPLVTTQLTRINLLQGARLNLTTSKLGPAIDPLEYQGSFSLESGAALNVNVPGTSWTLKRSLTMASGASVLGDSIVNRGRIQGAGELAVVRLTNAGAVAPASELRVTSGHYDQTSAGRLEIDIAGFVQGVSYDVMRAGTARVGGTLAITIGDSFLPGAGSQFDILTADRVSGVFSSLELNVPSGVSFSGELIYASNKVSFRVTQAEFASDFDNDGDVDGGDLLAWTSAFEAGGGGPAGDADGDFDADGADFLTIQRQMDRRVASPPKVGGVDIIRNIPEPATLYLALAALAMAAAARPRV